MEHNIGVGLIIGAAIGTSLYVLNSKSFNKTQKTFLLICIIFPPLQWISILVLLGYQSFQNNTSNQGIEKSRVRKSIYKNQAQLEKLKSLRKNGILTEEEYQQKVKSINNSRIEAEFRVSEDYIKLKSLFDEGILTEQEFQNKIRIAKKNWKSSSNSYSGEYNSSSSQRNTNSKVFSSSSSSSKTQYQEPKVILGKLGIALFIALFPLPFIAYAETVKEIGVQNFTGAFAYWFIGAILWLILLNHKKLKQGVLLITIVYTVGMLIYIFT